MPIINLNFEDGSQEQIQLAKAIEIDIAPDRLQSVCFNQTRSGKWVMTFTKPLFKDKK